MCTGHVTKRHTSENWTKRRPVSSVKRTRTIVIWNKVVREVSSSQAMQTSSVQFSSVTQLCPILCDPMDCSKPGFPVHHQLPYSISCKGTYSASCPSSQWCHPTISSSIMPFSSRLESFPASRSFQMSHFPSGRQTIGVSASASDIPMNIEDWFPLGLAGWISLQSKTS